MNQNIYDRLQRVTQGASLFVLLYEGVCLLIFWQDDYILGSREVALFALKNNSSTGSYDAASLRTCLK